MKTFNFYQKNSSVILSLKSPNLDEAEKLLFDTVKSTYGWCVVDEEGEDEE